MEMMKKAVIFDLDGTLADTLESIAYCANRALEDCGFPGIEDVEAYKLLVGNGARMLMVRALRRVGDTEGAALSEPDADGRMTCPAHIDEVMERYTRYFAKDCMYQVKPYCGIPELLENLKEKGVKIAVFSNKPHENTEYVIESLFGKGYFNVVQGQTDGLPKKPAPDGIFMIAKKLGVAKEEILYVGDSSVDMDTGKAAGVKTLGVLWGFRSEQELLEHGADALLKTPEELLRYL